MVPSTSPGYPTKTLPAILNASHMSYHLILLHLLKAIPLQAWTGSEGSRRFLAGCLYYFIFPKHTVRLVSLGRYHCEGHGSRSDNTGGSVESLIGFKTTLLTQFSIKNSVLLSCSTSPISIQRRM